ncbi:MAG: hypothetical protein KGQ83_09540, partial [Planctomycetes bacterium]|nr:hypothetical protein [Planctomycetota bacterium]
MGRVRFLMIATVLTTLSAGIHLSCQNGTVQDGVHNYESLLHKPPTIRVLLVNDVREARLAINGSYQITGSLTNIIDQGQNLIKSTVSVQNGGINIGNKHYNNSELRITSLRDGEIELNNIRYRGEFR